MSIPIRVLRLFLILTFLNLLDADWSTRSQMFAEEIVYHNSRNSLKSFFDPKIEYGDEIFLEHGDETIRSCTLRSIQIFYVGRNLNGDEQARVRFYKNDGEELFKGASQPGSLFFDSGIFDLPYSELKTDFSIDIRMVVEDAPGHFTWTIEFYNVSEFEKAGLSMYNPPIVGNTFNDYWQRFEGGWELRQVRILPTSFAAIITAEDIVLPVKPQVNIVRLNLVNNTEGNLSRLSVTGPNDRMYLVESSSDLKNWKVFKAYSSISPPLEFQGIDTQSGLIQFYRSSAHPQLSLEILETTPTHVRLRLFGAPKIRYAIEGSSDLFSWTVLTQLVPEAMPSNLDLPQPDNLTPLYLRARIDTDL